MADGKSVFEIRKAPKPLIHLHRICIALTDETAYLEI